MADRRVLTFAGLCISVSSFSLLQSLVVPVLTRVQVELDTDQNTVTWVLTAYLLSASICAPILGRIGDVVGKRTMLVVTLVALSVGSLAAALAPSIGWLIAARVLQGAGGGVLPLSYGIVRDEFGERMNGALSAIASLAAVGFGVGIVVAGPIVDALGYAWLFWLPMITTAVAAAAALLFVPESPVRTPARLPIAPAFLLAAWLIALLVALSQGNKWGWTSLPILGLFLMAAVVAAAWAFVERRVPVPMIDMDMMQLRGVWTSNVVAGCMGFGVLASFAFLPQLMQTPPAAGYGFGASITESGHMLLPCAVTMFVVGFSTARLVAAFGARRVTAVGLLLTGAAFSSVGVFHDHPWQLYVATTVQGVGGGLVFSSLAGVVVAAVPPHQTGVASGMNANIRTIGGAVGAAALAGIITARTGPEGFPAEIGYTIGFCMLGIVIFLAAGVALLMPDLRHQGGTPLDDADNAALGLVPVAGDCKASGSTSSVANAG